MDKWDKIYISEILKAVTSKSKGFWLLWGERRQLIWKTLLVYMKTKNLSCWCFQRNLKFFCKVHLSKSAWCLLSTGSLLSPLRKAPWSMAASLVVARCQKSCGGWSSIAAADSPICGSLGTYSFPSYHGNKGVIIEDYLSL